MSLVEDVKLSVSWEATQDYPFLFAFCVFSLSFCRIKMFSERLHYREEVLPREIA